MVASSFFCDIAKIEMFNPLFVQKACHHCQLYTGTLCLFRDSVRLRASMSHLRRIPFIRNDKNEGSCVEFLLRHCCPKSTANALRSAHTVSDKVLAASTLASSDIIITEVLKIGDHIHCNALEAQWSYCRSPSQIDVSPRCSSMAYLHPAQ